MPPKFSLKQVHNAVPKHLLQKDPLRSFGYIARDVSLCIAMFALAAHIDTIARSGCFGLIPAVQPWQVVVFKSVLWPFYWWWQGLVFTSFFCIGGYIRSVIAIFAYRLTWFSSRSKFNSLHKHHDAKTKSSTSLGMGLSSTLRMPTTSLALYWIRSVTISITFHFTDLIHQHAVYSIAVFLLESVP